MENLTLWLEKFDFVTENSDLKFDFVKPTSFKMSKNFKTVLAWSGFLTVSAFGLYEYKKNKDKVDSAQISGHEDVQQLESAIKDIKSQALKEYGQAHQNVKQDADKQFAELKANFDSHKANLLGSAPPNKEWLLRDIAFYFNN